MYTYIYTYIYVRSIYSFWTGSDPDVTDSSWDVIDSTWDRIIRSQDLVRQWQKITNVTYICMHTYIYTYIYMHILLSDWVRLWYDRFEFRRDRLDFRSDKSPSRLDFGDLIFWEFASEQLTNLRMFCNRLNSIFGSKFLLPGANRFCVLFWPDSTWFFVLWAFSERLTLHLLKQWDPPRALRHICQDEWDCAPACEQRWPSDLRKDLHIRKYAWGGKGGERREIQSRWRTCWGGGGATMRLIDWCCFY